MYVQGSWPFQVTYSCTGLFLFWGFEPSSTHLYSKYFIHRDIYISPVPSPLVSPSTVLALQACSVVPAFIMIWGDLNSCLYSKHFSWVSQFSLCLLLMLECQVAHP